MAEEFSQSFHIQGNDFRRAGKASMEIKSILRELGIDAAIVRRVAIAAFEAEMNVVMYARRALMTFQVTPQRVTIVVDDEGPGIPDIERAMQEGFSTASPEMREMGFGAGMGLPNIRKNSSTFRINSVPGRGTRLDIRININ